jgi:hypothetical protein
MYHRSAEHPSLPCGPSSNINREKWGFSVEISHSSTEVEEIEMSHLISGIIRTDDDQDLFVVMDSQEHNAWIQTTSVENLDDWR